MRKYFKIISFILCMALVLNIIPTYAKETNDWVVHLYKNKEGISSSVSNSGSGSSSSDGGSSSGGEGTKLSEEDQATHDSQQAIRKSIIDRIRNGDTFVNLFNNGQTSVYGGKTRLTDGEIKGLLNNTDSFQKNRTKGSFGNEFNNNDNPRNMGKTKKPDMTQDEKEEAQDKIIEFENISVSNGRTGGGGSSKNGNDITVSDDKIDFNSIINSVDYDPPNAKFDTYVGDLVNDGVRDFDNWDSRYETLRNYYNKVRDPNSSEMLGTGNLNVGSYNYVALLAMYNSYIARNSNYFENSWPNSANTFAAAKNKVRRKQKTGLVCLVPPSWGIADLGLNNGKTRAQVHGTPSGFGNCYSGDLTKYLVSITSGGPIGMSPSEACRRGLLRAGDICCCSGVEHTFVYSGYKYDCFDAGGTTSPYNNGIRCSYAGWTDSSHSIKQILRWRDTDQDLNVGIWNGLNSSRTNGRSRVSIHANNSVNNKLIGSPNWNPLSLEDFEDVAYIESYYLTRINRKYYKILDYTSNTKRYKIYDPDNKLIKEGETDSTDMHLTGLNKPGTYKITWWQEANIRKGVAVGYMKRQYLVLLPSNTILYYKEEFKDDDPVFIEDGDIHQEWIEVATATHTVKDTNTIDTSGTLIQRTE